MALLNKITYHRRLFLWLLAYSFMLMGCAVLFQYEREKSYKANEINSQLQLINSYILDELADGVEPQDINMKGLHPFRDLRISIINDSGSVIYDTSLDSLPHSNHMNRTEIALAKTAGQGYTVRRHSESTGDTYFYSARCGNDGYIVRTAVPYSVSFSSMLKADYGFLWFMGFLTVMMCGFGYFATRRLGQNISRLNKFAQGVERGDRISDTDPFPHDELGDISNHIVRLYARLQTAIADRDREHRAALHEQQEKVRIKKQLTNNINHELKTPVAAIQMCMETLDTHKNLPEDKRDEFIKRCMINVSRLKRLLDDVSLLTRMDDGNESIIMDRVNLTDIIDDVCKDSLLAAQVKNITIDNEVHDDIYIRGNEALLTSVFHNLIDNAIAYSSGSQITLRYSIHDDRVEIVVADNGVGVPEAHLSRLFERFYRIDKGRSRTAGGTGLGLSIVKNAVLAHGGSIIVKNIPGGGLMFKITLSQIQ